MAFLTIDGKQFEAKANFKFERTADKKYKTKEEISGLEQIYQDLMSYKVSALLAFWDCATAHYHKGQPSPEKIEDALSEIIENGDEETVEQLFKDAFQTVDNSGFFRLQLKEFWNNLNMIDKMAKDEQEKEQGKMAREMFINRRKDLNPSITIPSSAIAPDSLGCTTQN